MGWCHAVSKCPLLHWRAHAPRHLRAGAFLSVWLQEGSKEALPDASVQSSAPMRAGPDAGEGGRGLKAETASETPLGVRKAPGFLGMGGLCNPPQFFLVLGVSYFLLLEYHSSSGIPMEGRVMTPKAAQSRK